ncbi:cytochrome c1 [sulfur-oxidizing endosymbiont of Gigantopelta aegis]|uniref:cytochrome c1 n=1 Tax=sulfur-oxidizing endosymbiont of Gigantopelta aegis TaxID=2794934 RepID=UPI0018DB6465|nr:cytochrome c1 [sulfur-oxidizing endosymbiont of Gigantopelta aegis]
MKKIILVLLLTTIAMMSSSLMASGGFKTSPANVDVTDMASLQRGAKVFTDYCLSCHSAKFVRFNRVATDLGMTEGEVMDNLNHLGVKFGGTMTAVMTNDYAKQSFGAVPPDLSLVARSRGVDWLYTYLTGFYADSSKTTGHNNVIFKDVGMPNIFWKEEGVKEAVYDEHEGEKVLVGTKVIEKGTMAPEEFDTMIRDLVTFLSYIGEPNQSYRKSLGVYVLIFLVVLFGFAYAMKKDFWKDVH